MRIVRVSAFVVILGLALLAGVMYVQAESRRHEATAAEAQATSALNDVLHLSDMRRVRDLEDQARRFTAAQPDLDAGNAWAAKAIQLAGRRPEHLRALEALRARAVEPGPPWRFEREDLAWQHDVLTELVDQLAALEDPKGAARVRVQRMLDLAVAFRKSLETSADLWRDSSEAIAKDPRYGGLRMSPQRGLVPIGRDPDSSLFEFAQLGSGTVPSRDVKTGRLVLKDDFAIVLVLLPAGKFLMGAQHEDPQQPSFDAGAEGETPVRKVTLSAFFLSKYECTLAQWAALNERPRPQDLQTIRRPVDRVSWEDARSVLPAFGLDLPSEAQWEYGCRAGTTTPWWTGDSWEELYRAAWVLESAGTTMHAVGEKAANAFGLHDVHGNVWEWCADWRANYTPGSPTDPVVDSGSGPAVRVQRGGSWSFPARYARSARRFWNPPAQEAESVGFRAARALRDATGGTPEEAVRSADALRTYFDDWRRDRDLEVQAQRSAAAQRDLQAQAQKFAAALHELEVQAAGFSAVQSDLEAATTAWFERASDLARQWPERARALAAVEDANAAAPARVRGMHDLAVVVRKSLETNAELWRDTIEAIASDPRYGGLRIVPQRGLVPIGRDPDSALFEFAQVGSGAAPSRDVKTGRLDLNDSFATVLVLLPAHSFLMGAQGSDPRQPGYDARASENESPVRTVMLSAFFLSKYECTQSQWAALAKGTAPTHFEDPRLPAERLSWDDATTVLRTLGLSLPSEAQWEYACRAGTTTAWWTGDREEDLGRTAWYAPNADGKTHGVGWRAANAFGFHDIHGNVWEWCLDDYGRYVPGDAIDPVAIGDSLIPIHVCRGGAWDADAGSARSAYRPGHSQESWHGSMGIRPARPLTVK